MSESHSAVLHPVDFESLRKGQTISVEAIEAIYKVRRETQEYQLKALGLKAQIESHGFRVEFAQGALRLLTDSEYARHNRKRIKQASRKLLATAALPAPDLMTLTDEERAEWDNADHRARRHAMGVLERERALRAEVKALTAGTKREPSRIR